MVKFDLVSSRSDDDDDDAAAPVRLRQEQLRRKRAHMLLSCRHERTFRSSEEMDHGQQNVGRMNESIRCDSNECDVAC